MEVFKYNRVGAKSGGKEGPTLKNKVRILKLVGLVDECSLDNMAGISNIFVFLFVNGKLGIPNVLIWTAWHIYVYTNINVYIHIYLLLFWTCGAHMAAVWPSPKLLRFWRACPTRPLSALLVGGCTPHWRLRRTHTKHGLGP